jgi:ABC-type glycerol-3-phosphate transport system substrate-binding protein
LLLLPLAGRLRRTGKKLSRMLPLLLLLLAGIAAATGLSGCGGTPSGSFGQAPANYTIQVTGTSINLIHSTSVTLTIE